MLYPCTLSLHCTKLEDTNCVYVANIVDTIIYINWLIIIREKKSIETRYKEREEKQRKKKEI